MRADSTTSRAFPTVSNPAVHVVTRATFPESPARLWEALLLYEEIDEHPPWYMRLLLPVPVRHGGGVRKVGETIECLYEGGRLVKRVTSLQESRRYEFDVVEQDLQLGGGVLLAGGCYMLRERDNGGTEVAVETRYVGVRRPRWLWEPLERAVCGVFHRHLLRIIHQRIESP